MELGSIGEGFLDGFLHETGDARGILGRDPLPDLLDLAVQ
jgi:hypothetical protein